MLIPENIATMTGREVLTFYAQFLDDFAIYHRNEPWGAAFRGVADVMVALRSRGEAAVARAAEKRAKGERVWSETDQTVDLAIGALRSPFIRPTTDLQRSAEA